MHELALVVDALERHEVPQDSTTRI
jgi:hypothetical protein